MKLIKSLLVAFAVIIASGAYAQDQVWAQDTLTNADTSYYELGKVLGTYGDAWMAVSIDSISGTPAGSISYEWTNDADGGTGSKWVSDSTYTITDTETQTSSYKMTNVAARKVRIKAITSGTTVLYLNPSISFKRK